MSKESLSTYIQKFNDPNSPLLRKKASDDLLECLGFLVTCSTYLVVIQDCHGTIKCRFAGNPDVYGKYIEAMKKMISVMEADSL